MLPGAPSLDPTDTDAERSTKKPVSLRARALKLLARRDYSRLELERKLAPHAAYAEEVTALIEELQRRGWLSEQRLAEQLVRKSAARHGVRKVIEQLQERGIGRELASQVRAELQASELQRARAVWAKRFSRLPADGRERARQGRFLEQRGFDAEVIRRILNGVPEE